jgi:Flp pilus assembly protein TadD
MCKTSMASGLLVSLLIGAATASYAADGRAGAWHQAAQGAPALKVCKKLVQQNPNSPIANNDLGWAYRQNGDQAMSEKYLREAIRLDGKMSQAHSNLSVVLADKGALDEALSEAQNALSIDPKNPIYKVVLGNALAKKGSRKEAIQQYREAVQLKPDYENALYNLGRVLADDGQVGDAKLALADALQLDPKDDRVVALLDKLSPQAK